MREPRGAPPLRRGRLLDQKGGLFHSGQKGRQERAGTRSLQTAFGVVLTQSPLGCVHISQNHTTLLQEPHHAPENTDFSFLNRDFGFTILRLRPKVLLFSSSSN
ncbi:hypothetical protein AV530_012420 [Patagioenas fasciata monilis]|uniref:Uncharacterized protein n=1 Tax=Patagioenas fasciata monilis TaxID=372326 RepID=A0A1V4JAI2_PATFA|nr:hypothetical protein AV530_012420 [Patagioenas fasciata monilis]